MNYNNKTKDELIKELKKFQKEYDSLKTTYEKDISELKQVAELLSKNEELLRNILENSRDGINMLDLKTGKYSIMSPSQVALTGFNSDEILNITREEALDRMHPDDRHISIKQQEEIADGYSSLGMVEYRWKVKSGEYRWFSDSRNVIRNKNGEAIALVGNSRDITESKRAEETIRNLARFPSENPDPVLRVDRNGQLLYANEASYKLLTWKLQIGEKTPSVLKKIISEAMKGGIGKKIDTEHKHRIITFNVVPVVEAGYANFYGQDITLRKQADEENVKSKKLLEDLHKHLEDIRENERALISREIHDQLGQSMTALKLDLKRLYKYVNTNPDAVTQLDSMIELISDTIKDVQRISSDLRPGILDELGLVSAIEWYCDEFEKRTGIKCSLELENSDIDDSQISLTFFRVLQETLTNVIRHAKASDVKVTLNQTHKGTTLVIKDNGIGITADKLDSNQSLGLISMRERVRQFNGKIDISSKKGDGTKLTFFIPSA
jgi:PAS domain S-box